MLVSSPCMLLMLLEMFSGSSTYSNVPCPVPALRHIEKAKNVMAEQLFDKSFADLF